MFNEYLLKCKINPYFNVFKVLMDPDKSVHIHDDCWVGVGGFLPADRVVCVIKERDMNIVLSLKYYLTS